MRKTETGFNSFGCNNKTIVFVTISNNVVLSFQRMLEEAYDTDALLPVMTNWEQNVLSSVSVIA